MAERARRLGPLRFDEVLDLALYHHDLGFYATGSGAGRGGADFLTSPEAVSYTHLTLPTNREV